MLSEIISEALLKIPGVLKINEIPNARYLVHNGILMIELYDTMIYMVSLKDPMSYTDSYISFSIAIGEDKSLIPFQLDNQINNLLSNYFNYYNTPKPIIAEQSNLQDDPEYQKLIKLKNDQGMKFFKLPNNYLYGNTFIPVFSGFPTLAKSDSVSVKVYRDDINGYSIVEYIIFKNKIKDYIKMYFRLVNI